MSPPIEGHSDRPIVLATRGSALALTQTHMVLAQCRAAFPNLRFESRIIKTTGDKLQTAPPDLPSLPGTKGLFTKELEAALLQNEADLAVHSLKDLPTDLPDGLRLLGVLPRADARDVLICRKAQAPGNQAAAASPGLRQFSGRIIATSSTRRQAQLLAARPELQVVPIRGNVGTRLQKLADGAGSLDGLILAAAGLHRLGFQITADGTLRAAQDSSSHRVPDGLQATFLPIDEMLPCVGQGAIGLEGRADDAQIAQVTASLNHTPTWSCVLAERAFLRAMGGGCLSPVAAYAESVGDRLVLRAVSFRDEKVRRTERSGPVPEAERIGKLAAEDVSN